MDGSPWLGAVGIVVTCWRRRRHCCACRFVLAAGFETSVGRDGRTSDGEDEP